MHALARVAAPCATVLLAETAASQQFVLDLSSARPRPPACFVHDISPKSNFYMVID